MIYKIFSVHDTKVQAFMPPFVMRSKGEAVRSFTDAVQDHSGTFCKHPEDYALWQLGEFDDQGGEIKSHVAVVIKATEVMKPE